MRLLHVAINNKIATYNRRDGEIVCNNPEGYAIRFTFDSEWAGVENKIARFIWNGEYFDQEIEGDTCPVPDLHDTDSLVVGVFVEGGLRTTTDAVIPCRRSILSKSTKPNKDTGKGYTTQAQEAAKEAESAADRAEDAAARAEAASDALNTPGTIYATDDGQGNVTLRGEAMEMLDSEARAGVAELRERMKSLGGTGEIPTFDLVTLGLPVIDIEGEAVTLETDTTEIRAALEAGAVRFTANISYRGLEFNGATFTMHDIAGSLCSAAFDALGGMPMMLNLILSEGLIVANGTLLATDNGEGGATPATSIDLSKLDSEGKIVETFADGMTKTTTLEFDTNGNPIKITDGDGNVTTLTW